jgi:exopolysaccharide biosynthesis polyprenyl glycosylphosphotransferase
MLKRYADLYKTLFRLSDVLIISCCWIVFYYVWPFFSRQNSIPPLENHIALTLPVIIVFTLVFSWFSIYEPRRTVGLFKELIDILKASFVSIGVISLTFHIMKTRYYSGFALFLFWMLMVAAIFLFRIILRECLHYLRSKGYNLRHILIVGTGKLARSVAKKIRQHQEFGLNVVGFLAMKPHDVGVEIDGTKIIGVYQDLQNIAASGRVDQIILALPQVEYRILPVLLGQISDTLANIRIVPDIQDNFITLNYGVEDFGGVPVIRLRDNLLHGYNRILKRAFDFVISFIALALLLPFMAVIAVAVKLGSAGPVFYRQERMGLDGKIFPMIKFRSMRVNAESETGPVWAQDNDSRRTRIGTFLRRTSLDELPQFFNVLSGDMSLVGPRPERPVFIEQFKKKIPSYILRHKMKAGITGWAQIHGLRGNSSLEQRLDFDIYYIENWSLWLDLKILVLTIPAVIRGEQAY